MTGLRGAKPRCDRHRHGASTPTGEHIFAAQSPSAATVPKTHSTYTSCLRSWRRTSRAWMPYEVDLAGTGHRSGGRPETAMGLHRSLVSRSPMYAARAGSGLVKRCASSPPSQRSSATTSPDGLRDKTCQCPPAVSHRCRFSSADSFTLSGMPQVVIARGPPTVRRDRTGVDDHSRIRPRIRTRLRPRRTHYGLGGRAAHACRRG